MRSARAIQAAYGWYFAGIGCFIPFITLYYQRLHISGWQIGVLTALLPLGNVVLAPVWASYADTFSAHRLVLRVAFGLSAVLGLLLTQGTTFPQLLILVALLAAAVSAVLALLDGYAITISEQTGRSYGRLRVWGSVGFIAAVSVIGRVMGAEVSRVFLLAYAACLGLAGIATLWLPDLALQTARPLWQGAAQVLRAPGMRALLLTALLATVGSAILNTFFGVYLREIGGDTQRVGLASALGAVSEMPMLIGSRWVLRRLPSHRLLILALATYTLRFALYGLPPAPDVVLALQLLHGLSFGAYLIASVTLVHQLAGRQGAATAQGLLGATAGLGVILGSLGGGALLDRLHGVGLFRLASGMMALALVFWLAQRRRPPAAPDAAGRPR